MNIYRERKERKREKRERKKEKREKEREKDNISFIALIGVKI